MIDPYQPPAADLTKRGNRNNSLSGFQKFSTWYVFGLSIITLGLYLAYWLYTRTRTLNNLQAIEPIGDAFITTTLSAYLLYYPIGIGEIFMEQYQGYLVFSNILSLTGSILMLVWVFKFRHRLNTFLSNNYEELSQLGPVLTFFFQVFYLSFKLNQSIELSETET